MSMDRDEFLASIEGKRLAPDPNNPNGLVWVPTTEPRTPRWRMWAHQISFTLITVGAIEIVLWFFR